MREPGSSRLLTLLVLLGWLLLALGVWTAWVWARPAGLRVLGLDLAEYVKFVAEVQSGAISMVREVFFLPLIALSLGLSLLVHRRELKLPGWVRWLLNLLAIPVALAMLPPAWTPALLTGPEFVKQTVAIALCVGAALLSYPLLRRLPAVVAAGVIVVLAFLAAVPPILAFMRLRPALDAIYGHPAAVGAGPWSTILGATLYGGSSVYLLLSRRAPPPRHNPSAAT